MKPRTALLLILAAVAVGGILRGTGLRYGLPLELRPDENYYRDAARNFDEGRWRPPHDAYPGLAWWSSYAALKTGFAIDRMAGNDRPFSAYLEDRRASHTALRVWSWLTGTLTIVMAAWLANRLRGPTAAVASAWLLAVAFLPVRDAHAGTLDVPSAFVTLAAVLAIDYVAESLTVRRALIAGTLVGAAAAWRYMPALLGIPLLVAIVLSKSQPSWRTRAIASVVSAVAALGVLAVSMPYAWRDIDTFLQGLNKQAEYSTNLNVDILTRCLWMFGTGLDASLGVALAIAGVLVLATRTGMPPIRGLVVSLSSLVLLLPISALSQCFFRYLNPALPLLCIAAGVGVAQFAAYISTVNAARVRPAILIAILALGLDPAWRSVELVRLYRTKTTSEQVVDWFHAASQGLKITSPVDRGLEGIPPQSRLGFDPTTWPRHEPFLLALSRGGYGVTDWITPAGTPLDLDPACTKVAAFHGFVPGSHQLVGIEPNDRTDFPWRELDLVRRPGPDIEIWRVDPTIKGLVPPPPVVEFDPDEGRGTLAVKSRSRFWPMAYTLTVDREPPVPGAPKLEGILVYPAAPFMQVPPAFPTGRYTVTARSISATAISTHSDSVTIDVR